MNILINASNLKAGGGLQVAESICRLLYKFDSHTFFVVLPSKLEHLGSDLSRFENVNIINYTQNYSFANVLTGRDKVLDLLVSENDIKAVLTIFGPSRWCPDCFHLCGFAMSHVVLGDSPYWDKLSKFDLFKTKIRISLMKRDFHFNNEMLWSENEYISSKLRSLFKNKDIVTITNTYNQVFDNRELWDQSIDLPQFDGNTLLTVTASYPHKNLPIALPALKEIKRLRPDLNIRFVFTISDSQFPTVPDEYKDNFIFLGSVSINQCPSLYDQADIMFQPSLLECFSATYAEAMKMEVPILTTDLGFAHSLCGEAAVYYSATDPKDLAKKIIELSENEEKRQVLVANGKKQLRNFNSVEERASKLINILENYSQYVSI